MSVESHRSTPGAPRLAGMLALALCIASCGGDPASPPAAGRRVVVIGIDGATWSVLSPMMQAGRLPSLAALYRAGSAGVLRAPVAAGSIEPTASLWTGMATGRPRAVHGIARGTEKVPGRYETRPLTADRRRVPALWTIASAHGLTAGVVGWESTFPVETIAGFMIADGYDPAGTGERGFIHPAGALGSATDDAAGAVALGILPPHLASIAALEPGLTRAVQDDLAMLARGLTLYRVYRPRLAMFRLAAADRASHLLWQYHERRYLELVASRGARVDPAMASARSGGVAGAYEIADFCVGKILELLEEETTVIVVSGHGFRGVEMTDYLALDLSRVLSALGDLTLDGRGAPVWDATRVFTLPGMDGPELCVWLNVVGREAAGIVSPSAAPRLRSVVAAALKGLRTRSGEPLFRSVTAADQPAPGEPDLLVVQNLAVDPMEEVVIGGSRFVVRDLYRRQSEDLGTHDPQGVVMAAGGGIAAGRTGWTAGLLDIAPTVLLLLGLPPAPEMPGHPIAGILPETPRAIRPAGASPEAPPAPAPLHRPGPILDYLMQRQRDRHHLPAPLTAP